MIHIAVTGTKGKSTTLSALQLTFLAKKNSVWVSFGIDGRYHNGKIYEKRDDAENYLFVAKPSDYILTEATSYVIQKGTYPVNSIDAIIFASFDGSEHMELHNDSETYLQTKKGIFSYLKPDGLAIICRDIEEFDQIIEGVEAKIVTYGIHPESDYVVSDMETKLLGSTFSIAYQDLSVEVISPMIGNANMLNLTACLIAASEYGDMTIEDAAKIMKDFAGLKGRGNIYRIPDTNTEVIIDYAHTQGSLEEILQTVKKISNKNLVCIFGCGGNKSIQKRSPMGLIAEKYADKVIITNDNPRKEQPYKIVQDIMKDVKDKTKFDITLDRGQAIKVALTENQNSVIVIAGKGNEDCIDVNGIKYPYNDHETVLTWVINNQYNMMKAYEYVD